MTDKYLMVLEVSQKQAYIFGEKKLHNNILASDTIAYVTDPVFFEKEFPDLFKKEENLIYSGGGHTILIFPDRTAAETFARRVSRHVLEKLPGLELFIKIRRYETVDQNGAPVSPGKNMGNLLQDLEIKKSLREASFYQTTFGIEKSSRLTSASGPDSESSNDEAYREKISAVMQDPKAQEAIGDYVFCNRLEKLGGKKGENNFIAVVHIDGNQMGARVQDLNEQIAAECAAQTPPIQPGSEEELLFWSKRKKEFSDSIDKDFKEAFYDMLKIVRAELDDDSLKESGLKKNLALKKDEKNKTVFPIRKIITAGDDICFITEGRIGIECAVQYIRCLETRRNAVDHRPYAACAGIAIVHQKYPFYRAYDMAEQLCTSAKRTMADRLGKINELIADPSRQIREGGLSAIDWHIEYGEMTGDLEDIRDKYTDAAGRSIYARPYQITPDDDYISPYPSYDRFRKLVLSLQPAESPEHKDTVKPLSKKEKRNQIESMGIARSKLKNLRNAIKAGPEESERYCRINFLPEEFIEAEELFDALEAIDLFLPLQNRLS